MFGFVVYILFVLLLLFTYVFGCVVSLVFRVWLLFWCLLLVFVDCCCWLRCGVVVCRWFWLIDFDCWVLLLKWFWFAIAADFGVCIAWILLVFFACLCGFVFASVYYLWWFVWLAWVFGCCLCWLCWVFVVRLVFTVIGLPVVVELLFWWLILLVCFDDLILSWFGVVCRLVCLPYLLVYLCFVF